MLTLPLAALATLLCIGDSATSAGNVETPYCEQLGGINAGKAGTTTDDWANGGVFETEAAPHLLPEQTVSVLLGGNDARWNVPTFAFKANLAKIVALASGEGRRVVVVAMWDTGVGTALLEEYTAAILEFVDAGLVDLGPVFYFDPPESPPGDPHPTQAGHDDIAQRMRRYVPICIGDVNGDHAVGLEDFVAVTRHLGDQCQ